MDSNDFIDFAGYAWTFLPTTPGEHSCEVVAFCPSGTLYDRLVSSFLGGRPRYEDPMVILTPQSRIAHQVDTVGQVFINMNVLHRHFPETVLFGPDSLPE